MALAPPIGWPLLPLPDAHGRLSYPTLERSVQETIEVILRTRPGEQLMRGEFGAGLESLLHEPNTLTTRRRIQDLVRDGISRWEDRVILDRVDVWEVPDEPAAVRVEIADRLKRTGAQQFLGLVMELEG